MLPDKLGELIIKSDTIRVNFVDFWVNHLKEDNYFYNLLSTKYKVIIDENEPDIVFYSVDYDKKNEKQKYLGTKTKLVYYTGESTLPNWNECDLGFTFDYEAGPKNYRLPLWMMYFNWFDRPYNPNRDHAYLHNIDDFLNKKIDRKKHIVEKKNFCNFTYSNPSGKRVDFFPKLVAGSKRPIISSGKLFNNTGHLIPGRSDTIEKIQFLQTFKFTISFENRSYLGYTTEKLIHPMFCNSLPIYWGNSMVGLTDFNPLSFIQASKYDSDEQLIEYINHLDTNFDKYFEILDQPWFIDGKIPEFVKPENVLKAIENIL